MDGSEDRVRDSGAVAPRGSGRKTQRERREATVGKLVDATIAAIFEIGYARTSIQEICQRAGVSHGGLFRHFDTRLDLIVAAADEASRRLVGGFRARLDTVADSEDPADTDDIVDVALRVLEESIASPLSAVWHEVLVAARTDEALREKLRPAADAFYDQIRRTAAALPRVNALSTRAQEVLVVAVLNMYAGAVTLRQLVPGTTDDGRMVGLGRQLLHAAEAADMGDHR